MRITIYRAPSSKEEHLGLDPREIDMYKDCFDGDMRFSLHFFFVSIINKLHLTRNQINPNAWRKALTFLYYLSQ